MACSRANFTFLVPSAHRLCPRNYWTNFYEVLFWVLVDIFKYGFEFPFLSVFITLTLRESKIVSVVSLIKFTKDH